MPMLTCRRSDDALRVTWFVYYGDVRVGTIGARAGVPFNVDQWGWSCGFYPGLDPGTDTALPARSKKPVPGLRPTGTTFCLRSPKAHLTNTGAPERSARRLQLCA